MPHTCHAPLLAFSQKECDVAARRGNVARYRVAFRLDTVLIIRGFQKG
jgi:hypothetical protein